MTTNEFDDDQTRSFTNLITGTEVSHYTIISKIGAGGMGEIYLAEDTKLKRKVALKFMPVHMLSDIDLRVRFTREAQASAKLDHPNIVPIHEVSEFQGRPYFSMAYIEGKSLREIIKNGKLTVSDAVVYIKQICEGLHEAHSEGIVHRDIKPANILIDKKDKVRLLDFGLATVSGEDKLTKAGSTLGTIGYMSPEHIQGNDVELTSDLFSLGVVSYQMLTGVMPFQANYEAAVEYSIVNDSPNSIKNINPDIEDELEIIVFKLLEKDPQDRFQNAKEVIEALDSIQTKTIGTVIQKSNNSKGINRNLIFGVSVIIILIVMFFIVFKDKPRRIITGKIMLAVLPFENLGASEDEYFSDRMTNALTSNLVKIDNIGVISRRSAMLYNGSELNMTEIGEELNVHYLITGTIHWDKNSDNKIRIYTELIDAENDINVWTNHYDCHSEDFFNLQSSISQAITQALNIVLSENDQLDLAYVPSIDLEAYDLYLQGNESFKSSWGENDIDTAIQFYLDAIAIDSNFADAVAMLSRCYSSMYFEYYAHTIDVKVKSKQLADKSMSLQADQAKSFEAMGYYYYHCERDYDTALVIFSKGLDIYLNNSDLYNGKAAILRRLGRFQESCDNFRHAYRLDPRSHLKAFDIALTYGMMSKYDSSDYFVQKAISLEPNYSFAHIYSIWMPIIKDGDIKEANNRLVKAEKITDLTSSKYYWWLLRTLKKDDLPRLTEITPGTDSIAYYLYTARSHRLNNSYDSEKIYSDSVLEMIEEIIVQDPDDAKFNCSMGLAYAGLRNKEKAFYYGGKAIQLLDASKESFDSPFIILDFAEICLIFNENEKAIEYMKTANRMSGFFSETYFKADPLWQNLLEEESFKEIFSKLEKN